MKYNEVNANKFRSLQQFELIYWKNIYIEETLKTYECLLFFAAQYFIYILYVSILELSIIEPSVLIGISMFRV